MDMITEYDRAIDDTDIVVARVRMRVLESITPAAEYIESPTTLDAPDL